MNTTDISQNPGENKAADDAKGVSAGESRAFSPQNSTLFTLAWEHYDRGDLEAALALFQRLFERELGEGVFAGFAFDELVRIYRKKGDWQRLVEVCEKANSVFNKDPHLIQTLSEVYLEVGNSRAAIRTCKELLSMDVENIPAYLLLAEALVAEGDLEAAEEFFRKALLMDQENSAALLFAFSRKLLKYAYYERAEALLRESIALSPDSPSPLYLCALGDCLLKQKKLQSALAIYDSIIAIFADSAAENAAVYCNRFAMILKNEGFLESAIAYLQKAILLDTEKRYILALAEIYCELGEKSRQASYCRSASNARC